MIIYKVYTYKKCVGYVTIEPHNFS